MHTFQEEDNALFYIGLGGNLGEIEARFINVINDIYTTVGNITKVASLYESPPLETNEITSSPQAHYLNSAVALRTELSPLALLASLHDIEKKYGRNRAQEKRWGARTIDLDILFHSSQIVISPSLTIPHPSMHERPFVLLPLLDLSPTLVHPLLNISGKTLLDNLNDTTCRKIKENWYR